MRNLAERAHGARGPRGRPQMEAFRSAHVGGRRRRRRAESPRPGARRRSWRPSATSPAGTGALPAATGLDPKDRIAVANTLHEAILAVENGDYGPGRGAPRRRWWRRDPQIPMAQLQLGIALCRERKFAQAVPASAQGHRAAARLRGGPLRDGPGPLRDRGLEDLGRALRDRGRPHAEVRGRALLAGRGLRAHRPGARGARRSCAPPSTWSRGTTGRTCCWVGILTLQGKAAAGLPHLERAAEVQPDSAEAQAFLADAYDALGRAPDAARERARARELRQPPR